MQDIILNMFFTVLLILATLVASLIALYRLIFNPQGMRHVVVATFALPIVSTKVYVQCNFELMII